MPLSLGVPNKVSVSKSGSLVRLAGHEAPVALRAPPHSLAGKEELRRLCIIGHRFPCYGRPFEHPVYELT